MGRKGAAAVCRFPFGLAQRSGRETELSGTGGTYDAASLSQLLIVPTGYILPVKRSGIEENLILPSLPG